MAQPQTPKSLKRILKVSLVLAFIGTFSVIVFGISLLDVRADVKVLQRFLKNAEATQPNFEQSLILYTERTKEIIDFLLKLRPAAERDIVMVISRVEEIAHELELNIDIHSTQEAPKRNAQPIADTINYDISFYGTSNNLTDFLKGLEALPYFIRVNEIKYRNAAFIDDEDQLDSKNITINITLYRK